MRPWLPLTRALLATGLILAWVPRADARQLEGGQPPVQTPSASPSEPERVVPATPPSFEDELFASEPASSEPPPPLPAPAVAPALELAPVAGELPLAVGAIDTGCEGAPSMGAESSASDGAIPSYTFAANPGFVASTPSTDAPEGLGVEVPRDGRGMVAAGSLTLAGGAGVIIGGGVMAASGADTGVVAVSMGVGVVSLITGSAFVAIGHRRLRKYQSWESRQSAPPPRQGNGLAAAGGLMITGGAISASIGTVGIPATILGGMTPDLAYTMLGMGVASLAVGSVLTVVGVRRNKHFHAWRADADRSATVITPNISPLVGGAQIGLSGRF